MKQNQRGRFGGRFNGNGNNSARGSRPQTIYRNTSLESTGPCGKLRGTALQLHEKYLAAAKDAQIQNDDILAETCFQYADHYMHIQNQAIANEQAMHAQQMNNRPAPVIETRPESEPVTAKPVIAETDEIQTGDLKVLDLSVPVASMNQNAEAAQTAPEVSADKPKRKILRPRTRRSENTQQPMSDAVVSTPDKPAQE